MPNLTDNLKEKIVEKIKKQFYLFALADNVGLRDKKAELKLSNYFEKYPAEYKIAYEECKKLYYDK